MSPVESRRRVNGIELCVFEWGKRVPDKPSLLLAHATGFHARCWDRVVRRLEGWHVLALDQRGHGRSDAPPIEHWRRFGEDIAGLVDVLRLEDVIGVGHSMGGHAMTDAAAMRPRCFRRLLLIDPVIAPPEAYGAGGWTVPNDEPHPTSKRRNQFPSPQAMIDRFQDRMPYADFDPEVLRDYCTYGLRPAPNGDGFVLACAPMSEASVYMTSRTNPGVHVSARSIEIPVHVVRAKEPPPDRGMMDFSSSPTWPGLAAEFPHGRETFLSDRSHFIPQESPELVAEMILAEATAS